MPLKGRLHAQMPHRGNIHGRYKNLAQVGGQIVHFLNGTLGNHGVHELGAEKPGIFQRCLEVWVHLHKALAVKNIARKAQGKQRFHARRAARNDGERARGRDGGYRGVAVGAELLFGIDRCGIGREGPTLCGQLGRGLVPFVLNKGHDALAKLDALLRIIGQLKLIEQVGKAHDAKTDLAVLAHGFGDAVQRKTRSVDDIVQKPYRQVHHALELGPVNALAGRVDICIVAGHIKTRKIDRPQIAGLVGQQGLLAAGVGGLYLALVGGGIVAVDAVEKHNTRIARLPGFFDQQLKNFARAQAVDHFARIGGHKVIVLVVFNGAHEHFCQAHGKIEVVKLPFFLFGADKFKNIGVVYAQNAHVGPAPRTALLYLLCGSVKNTQKRHRARGHAASGTHAAVLGAQTRKRKARAAARFVDHGRVLDRVKNFFDGVAHWQHKTGRKLAQISTRVHERGRIGQKLPRGHELEKGAGQIFAFYRRLRVLGFLSGNGGGHAPKKIARGFC